MRTVYRLQGLVRRYGADRVEQACSLSLDLDVVSVNKIASMLERATENADPGAAPGRRPHRHPILPRPIRIHHHRNIIDGRSRHRSRGDLLT